MDVYTNQPLVLEEDSLWNQDEPNNYGGVEDCITVSYSALRTGLQDESCQTSKSCVLCSLKKHPQLQLREGLSYNSPRKKSGLVRKVGRLGVLNEPFH